MQHISRISSYYYDYESFITYEVAGVATNVQGDDRRGSLPQLAVNQWENDRTWYHKPTPRVEVL